MCAFFLLLSLENLILVVGEGTTQTHTQSEWKLSHDGPFLSEAIVRRMSLKCNFCCLHWMLITIYRQKLFSVALAKQLKLRFREK